MRALIVKEFRVELRDKKLYLIQLFCLAFLSLSAIFLSWLPGLSRGVYASNGGSFISYCFLVALTTYAIVPALAVDGIASEREEDTFGLLSLTPASQLGVISGKLSHISVFITVLLLTSLPAARLLALINGVSLYKILDCYLIVLVSAIIFVFIGLSVSTFCSRIGIAYALSYLTVAFFCGGTIVGAAVFKAFLLNSFSPFFSILNVMGVVEENLLDRFPKFLRLLAIYLPIVAVVSALIGRKENRSTAYRR